MGSQPAMLEGVAGIVTLIAKQGRGQAIDKVKAHIHAASAYDNGPLVIVSPFQHVRNKAGNVHNLAVRMDDKWSDAAAHAGL